MSNTPGIDALRAQKTWVDGSGQIDATRLSQDRYDVTITKDDNGVNRLLNALLNAGLRSLTSDPIPEIGIDGNFESDDIDHMMTQITCMSDSEMIEEGVGVGIVLLHQEIEYLLEPQDARMLAEAYVGVCERDFSFTLAYENLIRFR